MLAKSPFGVVGNVSASIGGPTDQIRPIGRQPYTTSKDIPLDEGLTGIRDRSILCAKYRCSARLGSSKRNLSGFSWVTGVLLFR